MHAGNIGGCVFCPFYIIQLGGKFVVDSDIQGQVSDCYSEVRGFSGVCFSEVRKFIRGQPLVRYSEVGHFSEVRLIEVYCIYVIIIAHGIIMCTSIKVYDNIITVQLEM